MSDLQVALDLIEARIIRKQEDRDNLIDAKLKIDDEIEELAEVRGAIVAAMGGDPIPDATLDEKPSRVSQRQRQHDAEQAKHPGQGKKRCDKCGRSDWVYPRQIKCLDRNCTGRLKRGIV